jgi:hypothetical protein
MTKFLLSATGALALMLAPVFAAEPTSDLAPKDAVRLIALKANAPANSIEISFIVEGSAKCDKDFEVKHSRRVAAILQVRDGSSQSRRLVFFDLLWNESLGWFMWETRPERGGDAVYIWSELRGAIVNR